MSRSISRPVSPYARKPATAPRSLPSPLEALLGAYHLLLVWTARWQDRERLREMDERMLRDIGLNRPQVEREVAKPFWRA